MIRFHLRRLCVGVAGILPEHLQNVPTNLKDIAYGAEKTAHVYNGNVVLISNNPFPLEKLLLEYYVQTKLLQVEWGVQIGEKYYTPNKDTNIHEKGWIQALIEEARVDAHGTQTTNPATVIRIHGGLLQTYEPSDAQKYSWDKFVECMSCLYMEGYVHGDLHNENLMVDNANEVVPIDFGKLSEGNHMDEISKFKKLTCSDQPCSGNCSNLDACFGAVPDFVFTKLNQRLS